MSNRTRRELKNEPENIATDLTVMPAIFNTKIKPDKILTIQYENLVWFDLEIWEPVLGGSTGPQS